MLLIRDAPASGNGGYHWSVLATSLVYRAAAHAAVFALPLIRGVSSKLRAGDLARRAAVRRWITWGRTNRDDRRPLLWVHAPSVGEGLQAEAVLKVLRQRHPEWQIVYSYFSPSAATLAGQLPVDCADYLPYDTRANVDAVLDALKPAALVFTKLDVWPEFAIGAARHGGQVGLIAGTVSPVSRRRGTMARALTRPGYQAINLAGAVAAADAARLIELGVPADQVTITGDPRFDSAREKILALPADWPLARLTRGAPTLVAGSTWSGDERILLDAWKAIRDRHREARLIIVPHEPAPSHLSSLATLISATGDQYHRLSNLDLDGPIPRLLVVDRVGVLAGLYRGATIGYVGGGFGRAGLHSVLEPAACGIPVVFGPRWQSSREAGLLLGTGAARALPETSAADQLVRDWDQWLSDTALRDTAGRAAAGLFDQETGADVRNADLVESLMARTGLSAARRPMP